VLSDSQWPCSPSVGKSYPQAEQFTTDGATKKFSLLLMYVDDTFIIRILGVEDLHIF
jgi:hypothetical protein